DEYLALDDDEFKAKEQELAERVKAAEEVVEAHQDKTEEADKEVKRFDGRYQKLSREVRFKRAERDAARANLDLKVRDGVLGKGLKPWQEAFDKAQAEVDRLEVELQELQTQFDAAKERLAELTKPRDEALTALKKHE